MNMKFLYLLIALIFLSLPVLAIPDDVSAICGLNNTLTFRTDFVRVINGNPFYIQQNSTIVCPHGCNVQAQPNECNPPPFKVNILLVIAIILVLLVLYALIKYFRSR